MKQTSLMKRSRTCKQVKHSRMNERTRNENKEAPKNIRKCTNAHCMCSLFGVLFGQVEAKQCTNLLKVMRVLGVPSWIAFRHFVRIAHGKRLKRTPPSLELGLDLSFLCLSLSAECSVAVDMEAIVELTIRSLHEQSEHCARAHVHAYSPQWGLCYE